MSKLIHLILIVLLSTSVLGLQISPAKKTVTLEPDDITQYQLRIINDQHQNLSVSIFVDGPFSKDIQIIPDQFTFNEQTDDKRVSIRFTHPREDLLTPGRNRIQLHIAATTKVENQFSGAITLAHNLDIIRLYDGAYLESQLRATDTSLALSLTNLGRKPTIAQASAIIADDAQSYTLNLGQIAIQSNANTKLESKLPDLLAGEYIANATLTYNDPIRGPITQQQSITFNHLTALLRYNKPQGSFTPGQIVQITLPVFLRWNKPLTTYTDFALYTNNTLITQQRSPQQTLLARVQTNITGFLDLTQVQEGNYTLAIATYSNGLLVGERKEQLIVQTKPISTQKMQQTLPLFALLLVILLAIASLLIFFGRKKL